MELVMFEKFLKGYVEAAVFTNGSVVAPIDDGTMKEIETDCRGFYDSNFDRIKDAPEKAGVDFHLTRNGHGAGFWDGGWVDGDHLTKEAKVYGTLELYLHEGVLYHHN
jgi:hypothetical protein